ncbi:hypothetical protein L3V82_07150 [Thiotrichales bacterium 19S3-7]|nr:hypothetical protein [Thiotrichales bacterium 19S3-7]MCF6801935.1 hypothetical protein [Thiotrichales bacterium 19S3-11]
MLDEFNLQTTAGNPVTSDFQKGNSYQVITSAALDQAQSNVTINTISPKFNMNNPIVKLIKF